MTNKLCKTERNANTPKKFQIKISFFLSTSVWCYDKVSTKWSISKYHKVGIQYDFEYTFNSLADTFHHSVLIYFYCVSFTMPAAVLSMSQCWLLDIVCSGCRNTTSHFRFLNTRLAKGAMHTVATEKGRERERQKGNFPLPWRYTICVNAVIWMNVLLSPGDTWWRNR